MAGKTFVMVMMEFFGRKPGETLQEFQAELKALTVDDKAEFKAMLQAAGYEIAT